MEERKEIWFPEEKKSSLVKIDVIERLWLLLINQIEFKVNN